MTIFINGTPVAPEPEVELGECRGCGAEHPTTEMTPSRTDRWLCADCSEVCGNCGIVYHTNSGMSHAYSGGSNYCGRCTSNYFSMCSHCSDWIWREDSTYYDGQFWCEFYTDRYLSWCDSCEEYHHSEDDSCSSANIHDYSFRPSPIFHALDVEKDTAPVIHSERQNLSRKYLQIPFMGFELEVEADGNYREGAALFDDESIAYLKQDGSLHNGFEIVTHPMTLGWAMENFPWDKLAQLDMLGFEGWHADTAGLHIHISRDGFASESHQMRFIHFIVQNSRFMSWLAGRESSRWASFDKSQLSNLSRKLRRQDHADRYQAVNVQNSATLEVRIFQSSLNIDRVKMYLQLVDAICRYTDTLRASDIVTGNGIHWSALVEWAKKQEQYPQLNTFIKNNIHILQDGRTHSGKVEW